MSLPSAGMPPPLGGLGLPENPSYEMEEPTEVELLGLCPDPFARPPDGDDAWLGDLSLAELDALAEQWAAGEGRVPVRDGVGAGFGRDLPGDPALGFAAGGPLDSLPPGQVLAGFAADSFDAGFAKLSDDELVGALCAARRLEAWQAAMEFTAIAELDARRRAQAERPESSRVWLIRRTWGRLRANAPGGFDGYGHRTGIAPCSGRPPELCRCGTIAVAAGGAFLRR